ncbi:SRPBCC family protein [Actinosynnema pretiosum subsp. pretiosum]|uniref:Activator of Hsp90 ATPase 1 family protein n=3 Tax=Actinosynnema TaxID=40566 RepID=C6WMG0_ACTMD|nr:Activator of Hsp90 ATPase 1 family protein [Actinosynnema mirum DSM 43827]AXX29942.1 hypothetical protein APASM_2577 [Actinosynnema pretiosum subsp. pretiosum]QUF05866.1 SRPBCC family protein [Actinosynnema pretiosum subsp. pretiosum]
MPPTATGTLAGTPGGVDLVLTRTFRADVEDVWASVTESDRTARWFGPWEGEGRAGGTVRVRLEFEDGQPTCDLRVEACEAPGRLVLTMLGTGATWPIELLVVPVEAGETELRLVHHLGDDGGIGEIGPGWEYYLDLLVAAREGAEAPSFEDYYPALKPHFDALKR